MKKTILTSIVAAVFSSGLNASEAPKIFISGDMESLLEDIYIYDFAYGGSGCPAGTVSAVMSPDFKTISMFFDAYIADSMDSPRGKTRKSCNLGVAVKVPQGLTVALVELDYRGYIDVSPGAYTSLQAEYFFAGEPAGTTMLKEWGHPDHAMEQDFFEEDAFEIGTIVWSPCGEDAIIRANTSIKAFKSSSDAPAFIQVDTVDTTAEVLYQLQWKVCTP